MCIHIHVLVNNEHYSILYSICTVCRDYYRIVSLVLQEGGGGGIRHTLVLLSVITL